MALTYLTIKIANYLNPQKSLERKFLVDSGAVYSVVDKEVLKKIGIKPDKKQKFILANGEEVEAEMGKASFSYKDYQRLAPVIFGEKNVFLLGMTTLEVMGLILDPINRELKPLPMVI